MTSEHIFPLWTRETVLPDVRGDLGYIFRGPSGRFEVVPGMPVASLQVKRVCASCNHGWLARLEGKAKALLSRPIQGNPKTFHFMDVHTIATWAYKTCILADLASTRVLTPLSFRWLHQRRHPPPDVVVTMACYGEVRYPQFALSRPVQYKVDSGTTGKFDLNAYLITISIGHPCLSGFRPSHPRSRRPPAVGLETGLHADTLAAPSIRSVRWPPMRLLNDAKLFEFAGTAEASASERNNAIWRYPRRTRSEAKKAA
jgi:hypothetical protein